MSSSSLIRVAPFHYIHVLDNNTNVQRVEIGPLTFAKRDHEKVVQQPKPMIVVPPAHYCIVADPFIREDEQSKKPSTDKYGQVQLRHGDKEVRFSDHWSEPFALQPGEKLEGSVEPLIVVQVDSALRLVANRDCTNSDNQTVKAGDEWLFIGPATYMPRVEVTHKETIRATVIPEDHALKLQARREFVDTNGVTRKAGEEWLIRTTGTYLPQVFEKDMGLVRPNFLVQTRALHLRAEDTFTDVYNVERKAGEEWLVTNKDSEMHLQDVYEEIVGPVDVTVLNSLQYCVVLNPVGSDGLNQYGRKELRKGQCSFFLLPGESLEGGIQDVYVLGEESALLLRATEKFTEEFNGTKVERTPGDLWMIIGPTAYVPPVEVEIVEERHSIPLDENEGIYVRDIKTGKVRAVTGQTYMLNSKEELWKKDLPDEVEKLLADSNGGQKRDKSRVVTYNVPHNSAVQIFDYKSQKSRYVTGPGLVMLDPEEQFTVMSLSGSKPKRPNVIKTLAIMMGPDFMTDILEVESSDHARLRLQLSYNWYFESEDTTESYGKMFEVRDFVGDACKAIASRVRSAVATNNFDVFHKSSAKIIREAVFGLDQSTGKINDKFMFLANKLVITNIDIQNVEPVDERTRESLQKSVQLAIEITTKKQERNARHAAEGIEQDARGKIERQKILNLKDAENERQALIQLQADSAAIQSTGTAKAEAEAKAEYLKLEGKAEVERANLEAEASGIEAQSQLEELSKSQAEEMDYQQQMSQLVLSKQAKLAEIETTKFNSLVQAIKPETIKAIARAGPEMQARLLKGLGLKGYLMTDGNSPINLFNAAKGMVGQGDMLEAAQAGGFQG